MSWFSSSNEEKKQPTKAPSSSPSTNPTSRQLTVPRSRPQAPIRSSQRRGRRSAPRRARGPSGPLTVTDIAKTAQKAWQASKYIMSLINVETKMFDVSGFNTVGTSPNVINLSNIAEGPDFNQREGNSILCQGLDLKYTIEAPLSAANTSFVRVIVVVDNDQRGVDPAYSDVFETSTAGYAIITPLLHYVNKRFTILYDHTHCFCTSAATASQFASIPIAWNKHIKYSSTTGADTSNWEGAAYLMFVSNNNINTPTLGYYSRLLYTDN